MPTDEEILENPTVQPAQPPVQNEEKPKPRWKTWLKAAGWTLLGIAIAGCLFIKLDTPAAAQLTDTYLRPILGDSNVVQLEQFYFNLSDGASRIVYRFKKPTAPNFNSGSGQSNLPTSLSLAPIQTNPGFAPLPDEGTWQNIPLARFPGREVMAQTFLRPDPARSFAIASAVQMDMSSLNLGIVAGTVQPGGPVGKPGSGKVPTTIVADGSLVAAFDGGFQYRDGAYGMIVGTKTYLPLKTGIGTLVGYTDSTIKIFTYTGQPLGSNVAFVRQNCPILVENGNVAVNASTTNNTQTWGRIVGATAYTWRSGVGVTSSGNLVFVAGNNLNPLTLAEALHMAGAVDAIQLDINPYWVRFNTFNPIGTTGTYVSAPLNTELQNGAKEYLHGYQKDFFYVYAK